MEEALLPRLQGAVMRPYWFDTVTDRPCPALQTDLACDLAIVGGGFTGLWTAIHARRRWPDARIVLLEAAVTGNAASGRNGGFCAPSISHGVGNARTRWPAEADTLIRLGRENLDAFARDVEELGIEAEFERKGKLNLAETPWQIESMRASVDVLRKYGVDCSLLSGDALSEKFKSPVYGLGLYEPNYALLNPAKMVAELKRVALAMGIEVYEKSPVTRLSTKSKTPEVVTPGGTLRAKRVALATNIAPPLLNRLKPSVIPIYDYAIMTRPLSDAELSSIGWTGRHSVADSGNRFHYVRKTADNRILWGGYDAIYHYGGKRDEARTIRPESFNQLARNFARALPQLADVPFSHAWGGVIDTSARTTFFAGLAGSGRVAYAMGFTGQGVSASRFAGLAMLDLLDGRDSEATRLAMLRRRPFPFPPEPLRWASVQLAQAGLAREDQTGKRSIFLKGLDALGIGFDS